jgi:hypothetical protein
MLHKTTFSLPAAGVIAMLAVAVCIASSVAGGSEAATITDLYSNLESCDLLVEGNMTGGILHLELVSKVPGSQGTVQERTSTIDGPGTYVFVWDRFSALRGAYSVTAELTINGQVASRRSYDFSYGGPVPIRFDIRDFQVDSKGIQMAVFAEDPTIADIEYMLLFNNKSQYITKERSVPITGGFSAVSIRKEWKQILENNRQYQARAKIIEKGHGQIRAFTGSFTAMDDALITDTYEDEMGASATIMGNSNVPWEGSLRFVLLQDGTQIAVKEKKTPVLLTGKDKTVEVSWNETLAPGIYQLRTVLIGNDGDTIDMTESVIEAKPLNRTAPTAEAKNSPAFESLFAIAMIAAAGMISRRRYSKRKI